MAKKDAITKSYMQDKEAFADAFNYLLFDGKQAIKPEDLEPLDTTSIAILCDKDGAPIPTQKFRDVLKYATIMKDARASYIVLGIENQTDVDYAMPVRNMLYDSLNYDDQVEQIKKAHRKNGDKSETSGEFLSGFHKTDKLKPVVTITIFFGSGEWTGPRDLHSMLDADEEVLQTVPNYPLKLIVPAEFRDEDFPKLRSEFRLVMKCLKYARDEREFNKTLYEDEAFRNVSRKTADVINVLTSSNIQYKEGEERVDMCEAIEGMKRSAKEEGREEGRLETLKDNAANMRAKGWSDETIAEILRVDVADVRIWLDSNER
ncbi:MAG: Rpn family recombination-promoting nuclease/putative transposase [Thermoguttaceae bacterium]|nr:Rpn family recombination-promoting nuclease/putative transposase [Thermoguttaceae bacterium]